MIESNDYKIALHVSQKLYGRDNEIEDLLSIFKRVCDSGNSEFILVAGNAGVGKSTFIDEVYKPLLKAKGYFIKGKFDLLQRTDPYTAFIQAFKELIFQFLADQEDKLDTIRAQILEALGPNTGVITEFLPELELIIGTQSPPTKLPTVESQNRFNYVFRQFISVCAKKEHPLVIFLDDLQWADQSSLSLIEYFLLNSKYLLMTGTYESNEIGHDHILRSTVDTLKNSEVNLTTINLEPLSYENVRNLISDTFNEKNLSDLDQIVFEKTGGNPFFIHELLKTLYNEKLIYFLEDKWHWNKEQIIAKNYSSNLRELIEANIQKLPKPVQETLAIAACIGSQFDLKTLSIICQKSTQESASLIWEAMKAGLIVNAGGSYKKAVVISEDSQEVIEYKFLHDLIQEAAYQFISEENQQKIHLQIGKLLLQTQGEQNLFAVVNDFNCSLSLIQDNQEKIDVANLNLKAARKANASNACQEALKFAQVGISLLPSNSWKDLYSLTFQLHKEAAISKFLLKRIDDAETCFVELIKASQNTLDKADIYNFLINLYSINDPDKGLHYGSEILKELGIQFPKRVTHWHVLSQFIKLQIFISLKPKEKIISLPPITSPKLLKITETLFLYTNCAAFSNHLLFSLCSLKSAEIHLRNGFTDYAVDAFSEYLVTLICKFHAFKSGKYWLDRILSSFVSRLNHVPSRYSLALCWNINHWYQPAYTSCDIAKKGMQSSIENGELNLYNAFAAYPINLFFIGTSLNKLQEILESECTLEENNPFYYVYQALSSIMNVLIGDETYEQNTLDYCIQKLKRNEIERTIIYNFVCASFYIMENYEAVYQLETGFTYSEEFHDNYFNFYYGITIQALILVSRYKNTPFLKRISVRRRLKKIQNTLKMCAKQQSYNFSPFYYLVSAEIASLGNNLEKASDLYNQAAESSLTSENWQFAALSNECSAKFLLRRKQPKLAKSYMQEAHYYYIRWGALAKVKLLEKAYPQWFEEERKEVAFVDALSGEKTRAGNLDYLSIIKSTRALSSEIILNKLLEKLMRILLENAGAQRGLLMIEREGKMFIRAENFSNQEEVIIKDQIINERTDIPLSLISYVQKTKESIVLANASRDAKFSQDPYIKRVGLKSAICAPILSQNQVMGFLYLENNATEDAFTKERLEVLSVLSSQAAISIENAQFYSTLEVKVADRTRELQDTLNQLKVMQNRLIQQEKMASLGMLTSGISHELKNPLNFIINFSEVANEYLMELDSKVARIKEEKEDILELIQILNKNLQNIEKSGKRADSIIQAMLSHARKVSANVEPTKIHYLLDQAIMIVYGNYQKKDPNFTITVIKAYDLTIDTIEAFPGELEQVFVNIIDNACYALYENVRNLGSEFKPMLEVSTHNSKANIIIKVKDNGTGISQDIINKIFEPFFTTKQTGTGTGLGLSITYDIITKQHNGSIEVKSEPLQFTEFSITLPKLIVK